MNKIPQKDLEELLRSLYAKVPRRDDEKASAVQFIGNKTGYTFPQISGLGDVTLTKGLLSKGQSKTQEAWWKSKNVVPNSIIWFQCLRRIYDLRNDSKYAKALKPCITGLRKNFDDFYLHTGTKIAYGDGLCATIYHLQPDHTISEINLEVPEFTRFDNNWSYLVLAQERSESDLENVESIPAEAAPVLQALLGDRSEQAGSVFSYLASRKDDDLREVRLWVPTVTNRNCERAVVLGVYDDDRFYLVAGDGIGSQGSARGVVCREK